MRKYALAAVLLLAATVVAEDSPLVALAKRTNRGASKWVITDQTLATTGGNIAFAAGNGNAPAAAPAPPPPAPPVVSVATQKEPPRPGATPAPAYGTPPPPASASTTVRNIEPQSSARTIDPTSSTVRTIDPTSTTVGQIAPTQGTVGTIQPQSTAKNIDPQVTNKPPQ